MNGHSLLVVPLPGLVSVVPPLGQGRAVPHIPLVEPFADLDDLDDGALAELRAFFADVVPFPVRLADLSQFPGGSAYLTPEPGAPFRRLTLGVGRLFPELPRRRSPFGLVPHLPVSLPAREGLEELQVELGSWLPVTTQAREAALWWDGDDSVRVIATFPFGTSAA